MQIDITGTTSKKLKAQLTEAAEFFAAQLLKPRTTQNITLDIEIVKESDNLGACVDEDGTKNPRWFTISLAKESLGEMIKTLGHEMVHVKQHAKNELRSALIIPTARGGKRPRGGEIKLVNIWKGEVWKPKGKQDGYFDSPWEMEAYATEVGLFYKWQTRHDASKPWFVGEEK